MIIWVSIIKKMRCKAKYSNVNIDLIGQIDQFFYYLIKFGLFLDLTHMISNSSSSISSSASIYSIIQAWIDLLFIYF